MSLLLLEGFDALDSIHDKHQASSSNIEVDGTIKRTGTQSLKNTGSNTTYAYFPVTSTGLVNEVYLGFAFYMTVLPLLNGYSLVDFMGNNVRGSRININTDGSIHAYGAADQEDSGANVLSVDTWYYIEIKMIKSDSSSAGDVIVMVDGVEWINCDAGKDFLSGSYAWTDQIRFVGHSGNTRYIDDLYVCDATGSKNNTFLGPIKIATLYSDGNGNDSDFVGSDADSIDNYLHVDDVTPDGDTTYVESNTASEQDLYTFDDMPEASSEIIGIQVDSYIRKDAPGARLGQHVTRVDGTDYVGTAFGVGLTYEYLSTIWEDNPDDAAAWEDADIDAAEFGIKVQT